MTAPTQVAPDDARHDYIARVYKMTHAELFTELMRVHTEANRLVEQAVKDERDACALACQTVKDRISEADSAWGEMYRQGWQEASAACHEAVKARGQA